MSNEADAFDTTVLSDSGPRTRESAPGALGRWVGARFDHYEVLEPLARGGMGAVYVGVDRSLERRVAIKVLPDELADNAELQERFIREARAQARLNSPHVAHIYYIGHTPPLPNREHGSLFFAMELVEGGALERVLDEGTVLEPERARVLMIQVARGLRDAQRAGIVHRDIKPSNLLLDRNGEVKIADFGVAKPLGRGDVKITQDGAVVGSPLYMAPEQARGDDLDHRADMYSLGCTFFHLLAGEPVFDGKTPLAVVSRHLTEEPPVIGERVPGLPPRLGKVLARLLSKAPDARYATYDALIADLEAAAPRAVRPAGFWVRGAAVALDVALAGVVISFLGGAGLLLHLAYVTWAHARWGQTAGKYLLRLRVRRADGRRLGLGRSLARTVTSLWFPFLTGLVILLTQGGGGLSVAIEQIQLTNVDAFQALVLAVAVSNILLSLLFAAGLALAAFHPGKRAMHDLVVGSEVVYRLD